MTPSSYLIHRTHCLLDKAGSTVRIMISLISPVHSIPSTPSIWETSYGGVDGCPTVYLCVQPPSHLYSSYLLPHFLPLGSAIDNIGTQTEMQQTHFQVCWHCFENNRAYFTVIGVCGSTFCFRSLDHSSFNVTMVS